MFSLALFRHQSLSQCPVCTVINLNFTFMKKTTEIVLKVSFIGSGFGVKWRYHVYSAATHLDLGIC